MMKHKKKIALVLALSLIAAVVLIGCGGPDLEEMEEMEIEEEQFDQGIQEEELEGDFDPFEDQPMDGEEEVPEENSY